jgi:hypothetical protein
MDSNVSTCCASLDKCNRKEGEWKGDAFGKKGYVYIQPQPGQSCKPLNIYKKPTVSFEDGTVYRLSYFGTDGGTAAECRGRSLRRQDNFVPASHMSSDTTHRHDYTWWPEALQYEPAHPHSHDLFVGGPKPSLTTQKEDYTPYNNIRLSDSPMDDTTITSASYQPIEKCRPGESFKPQRCYNVPSTPFAKDTVHTLSYMPPPETERVRGYKQENYQRSTTTIDGNSIYSMSYMPPGEFVYVGNGEERNSTDRQCSSYCECCA